MIHFLALPNFLIPQKRISFYYLKFYSDFVECLPRKPRVQTPDRGGRSKGVCIKTANVGVALPIHSWHTVGAPQVPTAHTHAQKESTETARSRESQDAVCTLSGAKEVDIVSGTQVLPETATQRQPWALPRQHRS
jgi:hypothetical protein